MDRPNCKCHDVPMQKNAESWRCRVRRNAWKRLRWANYSWTYKENINLRTARIRRERRLHELHT